jgi:hypothetical protein
MSLERTEGTDGGLGWGNTVRVTPHIVEYKKGELPTGVNEDETKRQGYLHRQRIWDTVL